MAKKVNKTNKMCFLCDQSSTCCLANIIIGIGIGALLTYPVFGSHPVKWGVGLIAVGVIYCLYLKKK